MKFTTFIDLYRSIIIDPTSNLYLQKKDMGAFISKRESLTCVLPCQNKIGTIMDFSFSKMHIFAC